MIGGVPDWAGALCNMYWQLRYVRGYDNAGLRKAYRRIKKERVRLSLHGIDPELIRLFCRALANPRNELAESRWRSYLIAGSAASFAAAQALARASLSAGGMGAAAPHIASAENRKVQRAACLAGVASSDDIAP